MADEVTSIREFLEIQKYRFGSEFEYELDVEEVCPDGTGTEIDYTAVCRKCLYPWPGKKRKSRQDLLRIKKEKQKLCCIIQDNGVGIKEEKLKLILDNLDSEESKGGKMIGIRNIYQRLKLYYGDKF